MTQPPEQPNRPTDSGGHPGGQSRARFRQTALLSGLVDASTLDRAEIEATSLLGDVAADPKRWDRALADVLVQRGTLTRFQSEQMLAGHRKLTLGQYRITDMLGQGGMGQVFKAEHAMMGRTVAVKVLPRVKSTPETEAAFQREIRMLGRLDHDNLVRALDAGHDGKVYYLVTEFVSGVDLRKQVLKYGTLDEVTAASVITQAARGLAYAHDQGVVHRDVKPGNMLVTEDGRVKVLDLGLAGSVLELESNRLGRVVGTMDYMSPEQIRSPDKVGPAADVYSLGCTLYFMLAGQVPFPGGTRQEKAKRQLMEEPASVQQFAPQVSNAFCRVLEAMMEKSPDDRIASATEVIERLKRWTPKSPAPMSRREIKRANGKQSLPKEFNPQPIPRNSGGGFEHINLFPQLPSTGDDFGGSQLQEDLENGSDGLFFEPVSSLTRPRRSSSASRPFLGVPLDRSLKRLMGVVIVPAFTGITCGILLWIIQSDNPRQLVGVSPVAIGGLAFLLILGLQSVTAGSGRKNRR